MKEKYFKIKLYIPAGKASSAPPIGPILGQYRLNLIEFCKDFNEQTTNWDDSVILPIIIIGYTDNSLEYIIKSPTTTFFLRKILEIDHSSSSLKHTNVCTIQQIYEIAVAKYTYNHNSDFIYKNIKTICGTLKTMNITISK